MTKISKLKTALIGMSYAAAIITAAPGANFNIPGGDLESALDTYAKQMGVQLMYSDEAVRGIQTKGVAGSLSADEALSRILKGTGFVMQRRSSGAITVVRGQSTSSQESEGADIRLAEAGPVKAIETVTVTSSKLGGADVQSFRFRSPRCRKSN